MKKKAGKKGIMPSYVEGRKQNKTPAPKSLTPKPKYQKKK